MLSRLYNDHHFIHKAWSGSRASEEVSLTTLQFSVLTDFFFSSSNLNIKLCGEVVQWVKILLSKGEIVSMT